MIFPAKPRPGDTVALVAPASRGSLSAPEIAARAVEAMGFTPRIYPSCRARHGYLAGGDALRARDLNDAFGDDTVAAIWCLRGGYGAQRLLPLLDWKTIAAHPKLFAGYSDITALHTAFQQRCGFVSYHTPMAAFQDETDEGTAAGLRAAFSGSLKGDLPELGVARKTLSGGVAQGRLIGGNLSLIASSLGTPWAPDFRDKILFLEDVGEMPYRVDGMLNHLALAGAFRDAAGVVLGHWVDCVIGDITESLTLEEIFTELLVPWGKPVMTGLACGHTLPNLSLPLGAMARLDADQKKLTILED